MSPRAYGTAAISAIVTAAATLYGGPLRYTIDAVSDHTVSIGIAFSPSSNKPSDADVPVFAYATLPATGSEPTVTIAPASAGGQATVLPVKKIAAGWMGKYYLQWISFDLSPVIAKRQPTDTLRGAIVVRYAAAVLRGVAKSRMKLSGAMLLAPLSSASLSKTAVVATLPNLPMTTGLKVAVDGDGIYELTYASLAAARVPVASVISRHYRLFEQNREVPIYCTASPVAPLKAGDRILFYGRFLRGSSSYYTQFSNTNVYWLTWSDTAAGMRMAMVSGEQRVDETIFSQDTSDLSAHDFPDTVHLEQDNDIQWLGTIDAPGEMAAGDSTDTTIDNWYWGVIGTDELTTFPITLPSPSQSGVARLRIAFMGLTSAESDPADHQVSVLINNNPAGARNTAVWDGQSPFVFVSDTFPVADLKAGTNQLSFIVNRRTYEDRSALNWVEIEYPRNYRAVGNRIVFKSSDNAVNKTVQFTLDGFTSNAIDLWDIATCRIFTGFTVKNGTGNDHALFSVVMQDSVPNATTYLAQTADQRRTPSRIELDTIRNDWQTLAGVDYVAVSTAAFGPDLQPLLDAHRKNGLQTAFVDLNDIYNTFSYGIQDPGSIRSLMSFLFSVSPDHPPRFLLLAGDCTSYCYKMDADQTIVPTHLSRVPGWGPASDDDYFVTVMGDDPFPDLCVGRFPANTHAQMKTMTDKAVNALTKPERGFWRDNLLLASGLESDFTSFTNNLSTDVIGPDMNILRMDADPQSAFYKDELTASNAMAAFINAGVYAVNFCGHGGGNIWSDSRFFGYNDLDKLHNGQWGAGGRLPLVFSFTCLTGFFESTLYRSLGEEFLRTGSDGALTFYGASALTSKQGNMLMDRLLLDNALDGSFSTVGELTGFIEINMLVRYGPLYLPLVREYNLLGDPATPWRLTPDTLRCALAHDALTSGDSLRISGSCAPVYRGNLSLLVEADNAVWTHDIGTVTRGAFARSYPVKKNVKTATGMVRAYAWNDTSEVRGWALFSKDTVAITDLQVAPPSFAFGDSVEISCAMSLPPNTSSSTAYCLYAIAAPGATNIVYQGLRMAQDSSGRWRTIEKAPLLFQGDITRMLYVYFRVIADSISKESSVHSFIIAGRPDLAFTGPALSVAWSNDSLRVPFQAINQGNAAAPPFAVTFFWGAPAGSDTIATVRCAGGLLPAKTWNAAITIPDTQGAFGFTGVINAAAAFQEITMGNNQATGSFHLVFGALASPADTLYSGGRGLLLAPAHALTPRRRVFLFDSPIAEVSPLLTTSQWLHLPGDSIASMRIGCRPALGGSDSLVWIWRPDSLPAGFANPVAQTPAGKLAVMQFDSLIGRWKYAGGAWGAVSQNFMLQTGALGPFALAFLTDLRPPAVQVFVNGRELTFVDYASKDKPFDIMISDQSGILPASVSVLLNRKPLPTGKQSAVPPNGDLRTLTVTAYPPPENDIDSLTVAAQDLAGNRCENRFAYMPGMNFDVKFLSCHPNPFPLHRAGAGGPPQLVRFAFLLTDNATKVTLGVYTVTGKRIWSWSTQNIIGYQEVAWDGRDADGYRIGNGTY